MCAEWFEDRAAVRFCSAFSVGMMTGGFSVARSTAVALATAACVELLAYAQSDGSGRRGYTPVVPFSAVAGVALASAARAIATVAGALGDEQSRRQRGVILAALCAVAHEVSCMISDSIGQAGGASVAISAACFSMVNAASWIIFARFDHVDSNVPWLTSLACSAATLCVASSLARSSIDPLASVALAASTVALVACVLGELETVAASSSPSRSMPAPEPLANARMMRAGSIQDGDDRQRSSHRIYDDDDDDDDDSR
jgi:hypothetical protein